MSLATRSLAISAVSLAIAAARRTETTACPVAAVNPAGSPSLKNYFDSRPSVGHTLYSVYPQFRFENETALLIGLYVISRSFDQMICKRKIFGEQTEKIFYFQRLVQKHLSLKIYQIRYINADEENRNYVCW